MKCEALENLVSWLLNIGFQTRGIVSRSTRVCAVCSTMLVEISIEALVTVSEAGRSIVPESMSTKAVPSRSSISVVEFPFPNVVTFAAAANGAKTIKETRNKAAFNCRLLWVMDSPTLCPKIPSPIIATDTCPRTPSYGGV